MLSTQIGAHARPVRFRQTNGPEVHVERYDGGSPTVVLLHGGAEGAFVWDFVAPVLAPRFASVCIDLRGHGESGWDPTRRYESRGYLSDLAHVVERFALKKFVLIGHSLGARLAIQYRARHPEKVLASVLVDFAPELNPEGTRQAGALLKQSLKSYRTVGEYADYLKETRPFAQPALLEHVARRALRADADGFRLKLDPSLVDSFRELSQAEVQALWQSLERQSCPTLIVRGGGSAMLSRSTAMRMLALLSRGELATVDCAGHSVMLDNPVGFERAVLPFLDKVAS